MRKILFSILPIFIFAYGYGGFVSSTSIDYSMKSSCKEIFGKGITKDGLPEHKRVVENKTENCKTNKDCKKGYSCYKEYNICIETKYF